MSERKLRAAPVEKSCDTCRFAKWDVVASGRLSSTGSGWCQWDRAVTIPKSKYFIGSGKPTGGYIDRHDLKRYENCPTWEMKEC